MTQEEKENLSKLFAARIIYLCNYYEISQGQLIRGGLNRKFLQRLKKGEFNPEFHKICQIAKLLNVKPLELLDFDFNAKAKKIDCFDPPKFRIESKKSRKKLWKGWPL